MAGGMDLGTGTGRGGRRPLDAAINLVPFIDLMAVTTSFLILTSVWTQIGRLEVAQAADGPRAETPALLLTVVLTERTLAVKGLGAPLELPVTRDGRGRLELASLGEVLRARTAERAGRVSVVVEAEDAVRYEDLVRLIDACVGAGLPDVTVAGALG